MYLNKLTLKKETLSKKSHRFLACGIFFGGKERSWREKKGQNGGENKDKKHIQAEDMPKKNIFLKEQGGT